MIFPSFAKINWMLDVLGRRPDGYHELRTIYQTIGLADLMDVQLTDAPGVAVTTDGIGVPDGPDNLAYKAAISFLDRTDLAHAVGVKIRITKEIPAGGGLGGGSSNAATAPIGLERMTGRQLSTETRFEIARSLGADVPLFLIGGTVLGVGRGDEVYPIEDAPQSALVIVNPGISVSTPEVFRAFSARLTRPEGLAIMPFTFFAAFRINQTQLSVGNDLERSVVEKHPEVGEALAEVLRVGAARSWMTGSGASVVGLFESAGAAVNAAESLSGRGLWARAVETIDRNSYRQALGEHSRGRPPAESIGV